MLERYYMTPEKPSKQLKGFTSYRQFVEFCAPLFDLTPEEQRGLYQVMLKLQSIGEDPIETMLSWKKNTCETDCRDFIRFMILVDNMDMGEIKEAVPQ